MGFRIELDKADIKVAKSKGLPQSNWLIVLMTLAGAVLRFYRLDAQSLWVGDEAFSAVIAADRLSEVLNAALWVNPPG